MVSGPPGGGDPMTLRVDDGGVVRLTWAPDRRIDGELASTAMRAVDALNGDVRRPLLVDVTRSATTREGRTVFATDCSVSRIALLGRCAVDRVIANFSLFVDPPPVPTRFFTDEADALVWLRDDRHHR